MPRPCHDRHVTAQGIPEGSVYDWFRRAADLLERGDAAASLVLIERVLLADPSSQAAREIRARALFDSGRFAEAAEAFAECLAAAPADDYAHYGAGLSLWRLQDFPEARDHLAMASVMRPDREEYARALSQVKATLRARRTAGLPLRGPLDDDAGAEP
jgi:tetratricopeptide (TPR) repeat protein